MAPAARPPESPELRPSSSADGVPPMADHLAAKKPSNGFAGGDVGGAGNAPGSGGRVVDALLGGVAVPGEATNGGGNMGRGEDGSRAPNQGGWRRQPKAIAPPVAAAGAAGAAAAGAGLYLSFESALVTLVLFVLSYLVFCPPDHRRRLRETLERMTFPLNVREKLRRRRMERELLQVDPRDRRGRGRRRRSTFHQPGSASAPDVKAAVTLKRSGSVVKLLSQSPRRSPPAAQKLKFACDERGATAGRRLPRRPLSKNEKARMTGAASAPTLPNLPSEPGSPVASSGPVADYLSSLEPSYNDAVQYSANGYGGSGAGYATHSLCTGLVLEGSSDHASSGAGDDLGATSRGEESRFAEMYRRSIQPSMYGKLVLPPECRLVEPPKGRKRKKDGEEGDEHEGIVGRVLSFFRRIRERVQLLLTIDYCSESATVFLRLAKALQYRRNRILGRPTDDEEDDDDDDASLASMASQRSLVSRGSAAPGPKPGKARPGALPRRPSQPALVVEAEAPAVAASFTIPRRPSPSSLLVDAPQSLPKRPSSCSFAALADSQQASLPRQPSASSLTGEGTAQSKSGRDRFYSIERQEEKKDCLAPGEEQGNSRARGSSGSSAGKMPAADTDENDTSVESSDVRSALSAAFADTSSSASEVVQAPQRQETKRTSSRSKSPDPLSLLPDGTVDRAPAHRATSFGKKRDALETYRSKSAAGIAPPIGPGPAGRLSLPLLNAPTHSFLAKTTAPTSVQLSPSRPVLRHSDSTPLAGSSHPPSRVDTAMIGPLPPPSDQSLNFFDAAGSAQTLRKLEREVPVPDKNGYIVGDEFLPNSQCTPLLVFVNSRSGSQQGQFLLTQLRRLLNPIQVWDLADGGPETVLESFSKLTRMRILVCGGDGTVSWILNALEKGWGKDGRRWPPVGILPLGTGNDLARVHGWGGGYGNESLLLILEQLSEAYVSMLDRWEMTVEDRKGRVRKTSTFTNYLGVGVDAQAALQVHMLRESRPTLFFSRAVNKAWYAVVGAEDAIKESCADLPQTMTLVADGVEVPLPADSQGIILLNIDSYAGGVPLWSHGSRPLRMRRDRRYSESDFTSMVGSCSSPRKFAADRIDSTDDAEIDDSLHGLSYEERLAQITACDLPSSCQDGMLDVVSIRGTFHLGQIRVGLSNAQLICQCREATIKLKKKVPVQIDGEPWRQKECTLRVKRKKDPAIMLHRSEAESGGVETEMANLLDWAEESTVIDPNQHAMLMREYSRRIESKTRQRRVKSQENLFFNMKRTKFIGKVL